MESGYGFKPKKGSDSLIGPAVKIRYSVPGSTSALLTQVRAWGTELLLVPEDAFVMVKQMDCPEEGCPPVETIIAILCDLIGPKQWTLDSEGMAVP